MACASFWQFMRLSLFLQSVALVDLKNTGYDSFKMAISSNCGLLGLISRNCILLCCVHYINMLVNCLPYVRETATL